MNFKGQVAYGVSSEKNVAKFQLLNVCKLHTQAGAIVAIGPATAQHVRE
jgi:hypothetical protein